MLDSGKISRRLLLLLMTAVALSVDATVYGEEDANSEPQDTNLITSVRSFPMDHLSGSMAIHALRSALVTQGMTGRYEDLVGISGSVFKFVYDSTEAYEPLRDACPFDLLRTIAVRSGFPDAHWETGLYGEDLKRVVKSEIDEGRPVVAPFLKTDAYHGFNVITGYDYVQNQFKVQGAFARRRSYSVPVPDTWDGPTVSPAGWATNPVFILGQAADDSAMAADIYTEMADQAIGLLNGGAVAYGLHQGERQYLGGAGPHEARYGLPAYEILSRDVEHADIIIRQGDAEELNFGLIWRIDAMVGLLEHDRMRGPRYADVLTGVLSQREGPVVNELVVNFERTAEDAAELRGIFWHEIPDSLAGAEAVLDYADARDAIVFGLPDREGLPDSLRDMGRAVYESPWGWVMVEDSPEKRLEAKMKVIGIRSRDLKCLSLMERVKAGIEAASDRNWVPRKWRPSRMNEKKEDPPRG